MENSIESDSELFGPEGITMQICGFVLSTGQTIITSVIESIGSSKIIFFPLKLVEVFDDNNTITTLFDRWVKQARDTSTFQLHSEHIVAQFDPEEDALDSYRKILAAVMADSDDDDDDSEDQNEEVEEIKEVDEESKEDEIDVLYKKIMQEKATEAANKQKQKEKEEKEKQKTLKKKKVLN
jgi:hypothetical protein